MTAHPYGKKGQQLRDIKGKHLAPWGETIMDNATEGLILLTIYWWPPWHRQAAREGDLHEGR